MNRLTFVICLALTTSSFAQSVATADPIQPVLEASNAPFADFVDVVLQVPTPTLALPKSNASIQPIEALSNLLWQRLLALDLIVTKTNKLETLRTMNAMCSLRDWLLKQDAYTNLLIASYVQDVLSQATLSALAEEAITVDEARQVVQGMSTPVTMKVILAVVEVAAPKSATLNEFKTEKSGKSSFMQLSWQLSQELGELADTRLSSLLEAEKPASLVRYVASGAIGNRFAEILTEYVARGGSLNLPRMQLAAEVRKLVPDLIGKDSLADGVEIEAASLALKMDMVREWRSKR